MKFNYNDTITTIEDSTMSDANGDATIGKTLFAIALAETNEKQSGEDKFKCAEIARKIHVAKSTDTGEFELSVDEAAQLKKIAGLVCSKATQWAIWKLLDGK